MFKAVIFDLGGVYFEDGTKKAVKIISAKYNVPEQKVKDVLQGELGTKYRTSAVTAGEFWQETKEYWGITVSSNELADIWLQGYVPIAGTDSIIDRLNSAGYEIFFLSDSVKERADCLQKKYPFLHHFKGGVFSYIAHKRKPDPAVYRMVLEMAGHPAQECIYIDDKPELLKPAEELGMKGILFENPAQLEAKLKEAGLKF